MNSKIYEKGKVRDPCLFRDIEILFIFAKKGYGGVLSTQKINKRLKETRSMIISTPLDLSSIKFHFEHTDWKLDPSEYLFGPFEMRLIPIRT